MSDKKMCPKCSQSKSIENFSPGAKGSVSSWCKQCINTREKIKREEERNSLGFKKWERRCKPEPQENKECSRCHTIKPIGDFSPGAGRCKPCKNQIERDFRKSSDYVPPKRTSEYSAWCEMRKRCLSPSHPAYGHYGGREDNPITIDPRWLESFDNFLKDMGSKPDPKLTLERLDNDKGYGPNNCDWRSRKDQSRNKRSTIRVEVNGTTKCVTEWCEDYGLNRDSIYGRLKRGELLEDIIKLEGKK